MLEKNTESRVHVEEIEEPPAPGQSIAFGIERLGLIAIKAPILSVIILAGLMIAAVFGIERLEFSGQHAGEDEIVLDAHRALLRKEPRALLILVPRHPERSDSVMDLASDGLDMSRMATATSCTLRKSAPASSRCVA